MPDERHEVRTARTHTRHDVPIIAPMNRLTCACRTVRNFGQFAFTLSHGDLSAAFLISTKIKNIFRFHGRRT